MILNLQAHKASDGAVLLLLYAKTRKYSTSNLFRTHSEWGMFAPWRMWIP